MAIFPLGGSGIPSGDGVVYVANGTQTDITIPHDFDYDPEVIGKLPNGSKIEYSVCYESGQVVVSSSWLIDGTITLK
tara:strand:- start:6425 stop:6655 length:231 start_codon:yes stop_codon:yes gene_type:complete